ncbi:MAG: DUF2863 family protein [Betaproteobacteria bacterium]|nr:DUF2863 family protein [Betaproteobacteria bacterium]
MKEHRHGRSLRDRKTHLSPDAERLVTAALGLASSGSRVEDRFWEAQLAARLEKLLDSGHGQAVHDALERLEKTDGDAYGSLVEATEAAAEQAVLELDGQRYEALLMTAPLVAWTRFRIPSGALAAAPASALSAHWQAHVLARESRFRLVPWLFSLDQLPRDFAEVRRMTRKLGQSALNGQAPRLDLKDLPETAEMLADTRYLLAVVVVPAGAPMFRWQELAADQHASRAHCLEAWGSQGRPNLEPALPGCGFELLLPDAYHVNLRESDRRIRPYGIRAGVHFLTHALVLEPDGLSAAVAAFGDGDVEEYRIGMSVKDRDEVIQGIVWPLLGAESEDDDPAPLETIRATLIEAGVTDIRVWNETVRPDFCEDCGAPLFPNGKGEVVHPEEPEVPGSGNPSGGHFH